MRQPLFRVAYYQSLPSIVTAMSVERNQAMLFHKQLLRTAFHCAFLSFRPIWNDYAQRAIQIISNGC